MTSFAQGKAGFSAPEAEDRRVELVAPTIRRMRVGAAEDGFPVGDDAEFTPS
jgi:hypothetical protein